MKIISIFIIVTVIAINCSINLDESNNSSTHTIAKGVISDSTSGKPLDSIEVKLKRHVFVSWIDPGTDYHIGPEYSNSDGKFYIEDRYNHNDDYASYTLSVGKFEYYYQFIDIEENEINEIEITLMPWPTEFHTIATGRFLEMGTEEPIENVSLYFLRNISSPAIWDTAMVTQSDNNGYFKVEDHYARKSEEEYPKYKIEIFINGYNLTHNTLSISANQTIHYNDQYLTPL